MKKLENKLDLWCSEGLIDKETSVKILDYEKKSHTPYALYSTISLAGLAIIVGIISVIASNWDYILPSVKLFSNLLWLVVVSIGIVYCDSKKRDTARELLIFLLFGSVLGSIALIGQVYHLSSHISNALVAWVVITTPIVFHSRFTFIPHVWAISFTVTLITVLDRFKVPIKEYNIESLAFISPFLVLFCLLHSGLIKKIGSNFHKAVNNVSWAYFISLITVFTGHWYNSESTSQYIAALIGLSLLALLIIVFRGKIEEKVSLFVMICSINYFIPFMIPHGDLDAVGGISFILIWLFIAWLSNSYKFKQIFNFATFAIGVRIIVIYFEVFGSLLDTGLGLITGGLVTLLVTWLWLKHRGKLELLLRRVK